VYERDQPEHPYTLKIRNNFAELKRAKGEFEVIAVLNRTGLSGTVLKTGVLG
jgi:hypothetical protein